MLSSVQTTCQRDSSSLVSCDKILKPPTMILHRSLAEDQHNLQFPEIPFIPRSFYSRPLPNRRDEVSYLRCSALPLCHPCIPWTKIMPK